MDGSDLEQNLGITRRSLIRRGAIVGGTLMWAAPAVQTFARPAFAEGTAGCRFDVIQFSNGQCTVIGECTASPACCDCLEAGNPGDDCKPECDTQSCHSVAHHPCA